MCVRCDAIKPNFFSKENHRIDKKYTLVGKIQIYQNQLRFCQSSFIQKIISLFTSLFRFPVIVSFPRVLPTFISAQNDDRYKSSATCEIIV